MKKPEKQVILGKDIAFNRKALENKNTKELILSHTNKKDTLKQRDSGLNQVLCKIAREKNIILTIDLKELENKEKAEILGRIIQNIRLIKKYKNKFKLINFKNKSQAFSFLISLGLSTDLAKQAIN